jgi:putative nucleotidyltransferase with HDIG domain
VEEQDGLRQVVERVTSLPTIAGNVIRILRLLDHPAASTTAVGQEIARDQVLSAKVLRLVNSGFYGFSRPITTIPHAMLLLGFGLVRTLVLTTGVLDLMERSTRRLWTHSLRCAQGCAILARRLDLVDVEEIGVAGLLHDLGKVVLAQNLPTETRRIAERVQARGVAPHAAELDVLGVTHAQIGGWLLAKWQLPPLVVEPVRDHHSFCPHHAAAERTAVVHLADCLVQERRVGSDDTGAELSVCPEALEFLGLTPDDLREIGRVVEGQLGEPGGHHG